MFPPNLPTLRRRLVALSLAAGLAPGLADDAAAAGYGLRESGSAAAFGNAFAGATAGAEDVSYMAFNPAALGRLEGRHVAVNVLALAPRAEFEGGSATTVLGGGIGGNPAGGDIAEDAAAPAFYAMESLGPDLRLGLALWTPWGLSTDNPAGWIGRYHALKSHLESVNINPVVAYRVLGWLSLGAGLQVQRVDAELSNAIDFGTIGAANGIPGAVPAQQDGRAKLEGDDWGAGYTLGLLAEITRSTRLGLAFRSKVSHSVEGGARFDLDSAGIGAALVSATGAFVDTGARASLETPEILSFGVYHDVTPEWAVMAEAAWTRWSRLQELRIVFDNPNQSDDVTQERWENSWFYAAGATWRPDDVWAVRLGLAYDESPVPVETRTPRIPDNDRFWMSLGATFQPRPWATVSLAYTHMFLDDAAIDLRTSQPGNTFRGNLSGSYEVAGDFLALQAAFRF